MYLVYRGISKRRKERKKDGADRRSGFNQIVIFLLSFIILIPVVGTQTFLQNVS